MGTKSVNSAACDLPHKGERGGSEQVDCGVYGLVESARGDALAVRLTGNRAYRWTKVAEVPGTSRTHSEFPASAAYVRLGLLPPDGRPTPFPAPADHLPF